MEKILPVFVYGSLLPGFHNHQLYVQPYPHRMVAARLRGAVYHLPSGYPGLLHDNQSQAIGWVQGQILQFADDVYATVLARLDELETFYAPGDPRNEYERIVTEAVLTETGETIPVYTYVYLDPAHAMREGILVADGDWRTFVSKQR